MIMVMLKLMIKCSDNVCKCKFIKKYHENNFAYSLKFNLPFVALITFKLRGAKQKHPT